MYLFNFHTHSCFCDGSDHPEVFIKEAIKKNFSSIGFSGHSPLPFENNFAIKEKYLQRYCDTIRDLKIKYKDNIKVFLALELDHIPGLTKDFSLLIEECKLEYTIGSVHMIPSEHNDKLWFIDGPKRESFDTGLNEVFNGDIVKGVTAYFEQIMEMLQTQKPDVVGHLDKVKMHNQDRFFKEDEKWYRDLTDKTLRIIKETGAIIEVNTRGIYKKRCPDLFPGPEIIEKAYALGIPVTISSDAHHPSELDNCFDIALKTIKDIGYKRLSMFSEKGWTMVDIREWYT
jgi:histidinol-phosphatase (PHP family)